MSKSIVALGGPTASGKTDWAIRLARQIGGAVIAADSRTVYQGLNVGTGKVTTEHGAIRREGSLGPVFLVGGVEHWGLDLVPPTQQFTAARFQDYALTVIRQLWRRGLVPILVGGTGLYLDAVLRGYRFPPAFELPAEWAEQSTEVLWRELVRLDPTTAQAIDRQNPARLRRALAFVMQTGQSFHQAQRRRPLAARTGLWVIDRPRSELYVRIDARLETWLGNRLVEEVKGLLASGLPEERLRRIGQVYRATADYVLGRVNRQDFVARLQGELHAYARRQLVWWRHRPDVTWVSGYTEWERQVRLFLGTARSRP